MIATWILYALLVSVLLAGAAAGLEAVCRIARLPVRWLWAGAMLLTLTLAGAAPARMATPAAWVPEGNVGASADGPAVIPTTGERTLTSSLFGAGRGAVSQLDAALAEAGRRAPREMGLSLVLLWIGASLAALCTIGATHRRSQRERRRWPASHVQGLRVRLAPDVGPAVVGVARPEIVLPRWFFRLRPEESRLVLAHEREHIRARDPILLTLGWVTAALLPWNPAIWWMLGRLRLGMELDCDRRVLGKGADPSSYGTVLIDLSGRASRLRIGMLALADPPSQLERRLLAMTFQRTRSAAARAAVLGALSVIALAAACAAELPSAADIRDLSVTDAERAARQASLLPDSNTIYTLDGEVVTPEVARAVAPARIAGVDVQRATTPGGPSSITIVTHDAAASGLSAIDSIAIPTFRLDALPNGSPAVAAQVNDVAIDVDAAPHPAPSIVVSTKLPGAGKQLEPKPLFIIDGVRYTRPPLDVLEGKIVSISVIKDRAMAVKLAGPEGANGIVVMRTKVGPSRPPVIVTGPGPNPVYMIDGVRSSEAEVQALDPARIESVNVVKGPSAVKLAGPDGTNGVVEVRTKAVTP